MYKNKYNLKFGCDPELFAITDALAPMIEDYDPTLPFAISPAAMNYAYQFKPLDKEIKHPLYLEGDHYRIVGDGVAYEINLKGPCTSPQEMWEKVNIASMRLQEALISYGCSLYRKPVVNFDYGRYWRKDLADDNYEYWSTVFGCDADQDAFNTSMSCIIEDVSHHPFRYGGGHIHFSGDVEIEQYPISLIKLLALTVGNYVNLVSPNPVQEQMRSKYYGKPGKYRIQKYPDGSTGVEYRTPSNSWLELSYDEFETIFYYVDHALYLLKNPLEGKRTLANYEEQTVAAILTSNKVLSNEVLNKLEV